MTIPQDKRELVLVLHCTWLQDEETSNPFFFVWGENDAIKLKDSSSIPSPHAAANHYHPLQSSCEQLSKARYAILPSDQDLQADSNENPTSVLVSFLLPTTNNGVPQLSSAQADNNATSLHQWKIKGVKLDPKESIPFLLRVGDSVRNGTSGVPVEGGDYQGTFKWRSKKSRGTFK